MSNTKRPPSLLLVLFILFLFAPPTAAAPLLPVWDTVGGQASAHLGAAIATGGDLNGDGFSDLLIAAPDYDDGIGMVFVYCGDSAGLPDAPSYAITSTTTDAAHFGAAIATGGDLNGDGYWDIIIAAPDYDGGRGAVFAYYGGPTGPSPVPDWSVTGSAEAIHLGAAIATGGDLNGDGFSDLLIAAPDDGPGFVAVYYGGADGPNASAGTVLTGTQPGERFGAAIAGAWDVNGDGYDDIVIGAPGYDGLDGTLTLTDTGRVMVYYGGADGLGDTSVWSVVGGEVGKMLGAAVAGAGDGDGDGYGDIAIGADGTVFVYRGGADGPTDRPIPIPIAGGPPAVAGAGDVNGDGYGDLLIGRPDAETVNLHLGGPGGPAAAADLVLTGGQTAAGFGAAVAGAGDVDGDGYGDIAIGAPGYDRTQPDEGGAFLYRGLPDGLADSPAWTKTGDHQSGLLGWSVAGAGDVNGDGFSDLLIAAPRSGTDEEGVAYLFLGRSGGLADFPVWTGRGGQDWAWFGASLAAGDVNGDGFSDLLIAAPRYDGEGFDDGRVFLYLGGPDGPETAPAWISPPEDRGTAVFGLCARFGYALALGDVNGDGFADALITANGYDGEETNEGAAYLYLGGPEGLTDVSAWTVHPTDQPYANFGRSAAIIGDVNGDGYGDIAIGAPWYDPDVGDDYIDRGAVYIYYGGAVGPSATADLTIVGGQREELFGTAVAGAGDVNGDGYDDLLIGAYQHTPSGGEWRAGAVFVHYGGPDGLAATPARTLSGTQRNERFGLALAGAGDVNGDGYGDLLIGAFAHGDESSRPGVAFVHHGGPAGPDSDASWQGDGGQSGAGYGLAVAGVGDLNGDGFDDIAVGAPTYNGLYLDTGGVFVYLGGGGGGLPVRPRQYRPVSGTPIGVGGASDCADRVQLRVTGRSPLGRDAVTFRWQIVPATTAFTAGQVISGTAPAWTDTLTTGVTLTRTLDGLVGGTVYRWRVRVLYRPGNPLGQVAGRWLYPSQGMRFRTPRLLSPDRNGTVAPGGVAIYTHTLHNPLGFTQMFTLTARSEQGYTVTVTGTRVLTGFGIAPVTVTVTTPGHIVGPTWETTVITATGGLSGRDLVRDVTYIAAAALPTGLRDYRGMPSGLALRVPRHRREVEPLRP